MILETTTMMSNRKEDVKMKKLKNMQARVSEWYAKL